MTSNGRTKVSITLVVALIASYSAIRAAGVSPVTVRYSGPAQVTLNEPIIVEFVVENWSSESIKFDLGLDRTRHFGLVITRPDGAAVRAPSVPPDSEGIKLIGRTSVAPGDRYVQNLLLNEWSSFKELGKYTVEITLRAGVYTAGGTRVDTSTDAVIAFIVGPRDESVLVRTCNSLASEVIAHTDGRYEAARALSYVTDPIAVGYIENALGATDEVDWILIPGLVRIASPEARTLLATLARSNLDGRAALAQFGLMQLGLKW
jgi:hypothetical protein